MTRERISQRALAAAVLVVFAMGAGAGTAQAQADGDAAAGASAVASLLPRTDLIGLEPDVVDQLREAESLMERLLATGAERETLSESWRDLGKLYHAYELWEPAAACYRLALALTPDDGDSRYLLAYLSQQTGRFDEARRLYRELTEADKGATLAWLRLAETELALDHVDEAKAAALEALYLNPREVATIALLGEIALAEKRYGLAVTYLGEALRAEPAASRLHYPLAMAYRGAGDTQAAREHLEQKGAVGVRPHDPLVDSLTALLQGERSYVIRGRLAYQAGDLQGAETSFSAALAANPKSIPALTNLGATLAREGKIDEAMERFRAALAVESGNLSANFNLAQLLVSKGRFADAAPLIAIVVAAKPKDADALVLYARVLAQTGHEDDALDRYEQAAQADPANREAWLRGPQLLMDLGRYADAIRVLRQAHAKLPDDTEVTHALARLLATAPTQGDRDGGKALTLARAVYDQAPSAVHAETLALSHAELGECDEARKMLEQAMSAVDPADPLTGQARSRIGETLDKWQETGDCRPAGDSAAQSAP